MLHIDAKKIRHIINDTCVFDAREEDHDIDLASDEADIVGAAPVGKIYEELSEYIRGLDEDEQVELVALAWLGRGTYSIAEWSDAIKEAREAYNKRTAEYLTSLPMLGDYLDEGLAIVEDTAAITDEHADGESGEHE